MCKKAIASARDAQVRFRFIEPHARTFPARFMCRVLQVSSSGYYAWRSRPESPRAIANRGLLPEVQRLHRQHHGRYGSPRIHAALRSEGHGPAAAGANG